MNGSIFLAEAAATGGTINFAQGFMICLVSGMLVLTFIKLLRDKKNGTGGYAKFQDEEELKAKDQKKEQEPKK